MGISRRYWRNFDIPLLLAALALTGLGMIAIYSASATRLLNGGDSPFYYVKRQGLFALIGLIGMMLILSIDYRAWRRWSRNFYFLSLALLGAVLFIGKTTSGSQRWFKIGTFNLQPSEVAKILLILVLAHYLNKRENIQGWKVLYPLFLISLPVGLIMLQPDMGTSMVFIGIVFTMIYIAGANGKHLALIGVFSAVAVAFVIYGSLQGWLGIIKPYQITRLLIFLDPYSDPTGAGWNVIQSMIAVGSGGILGKGFLNGTQSQLNFLPANHTDFIFSVVAEEFGFVGSVIALILFLIIIWRGIKIASHAKDRYGMLLAIGCVALFSSHLVINVGMTLGIMPVTGLPLPFLTYGGSTLLTSYVAIGIMLNVGLRRQKIMF